MSPLVAFFILAFIDEQIVGSYLILKTRKGPSARSYMLGQMLNEVTRHVVHRAQNCEACQSLGSKLVGHHHMYARLLLHMPCSAHNTQDSVVMLHHNQHHNDCNHQTVIQMNESLESTDDFLKIPSSEATNISYHTMTENQQFEFTFI